MKTKQKMNCPLCEEELYSGIGKGCKMCGMIVEDGEEFCSIICKKNYLEINLGIKKCII